MKARARTHHHPALAGLLLTVSLFGAALVVSPDVAVAQTATVDPGSVSVPAQLEEHFEVLRLTDGFLLRPREAGTGYEQIEIRAARVAVDGDALDRFDLEDRLGVELAAPVWALAEALAGRPMPPPQVEAPPAPPAIDEDVVDLDAARISEDEEADDAKRWDERRPYRIRREAQVSFGSSVTVEEDESASDVVVLGGGLEISGEVRGDAVAVGGSVEIDGRVDGNVTAVGGSVSLGPGAVVRGDVVSVGGSVHHDPDARVLGEISEVSFGPHINFGDWDWDEDIWWPGRWSPGWFAFGWGGFFGRLFRTAVLTLILLLIVVVARQMVTNVAARAEQEPWKAGLVGLLAQVLFIPLFAVVLLVLVVSILGIPIALLLAPLTLMVVVLAFVVGYAGVALTLGRHLEGRAGWQPSSVVLPVLLGVLLIQGWSILGHLLTSAGGPIHLLALGLLFFGFCIKYVAWTVGLGAVLLNRFSPLPTPAPSGYLDPPESPWDEEAPVPPPPAPPEAPTGEVAPQEGETIDSGDPPESSPSSPQPRS